MAIQNLFRLQFIDDRANVILLGNVGLGKTTLPRLSVMATSYQIATIKCEVFRQLIYG